MTPKTLVFALASLTAASFAQAQWTSLASDNFESYTFGEQPGGNWYKLGSNASSGANELITDASGGTASASGIVLPATGTDKALYFYDNATPSTSRAGLNLDTSGSSNYDVVRVSLDFNFATVDLENTGSFGIICLTSAGNTSFGGPLNQAMSITLRYDGTLAWSGGSLAIADTNWHSMEIVANETDSSFSYDALDSSGQTSIDANSFDLYVDGARVGSSIALIQQDDDSYIELGRFGVNTYSTAVGADFMIDNLETFTAPIPEPAESAAMLGAVALLVGFLLRRRKL
ncbi:hypothetical protein [Ruficoccus sp. ZRK36]|uniref:hypothetical protein n=1 Tax=Ruficoccus sp. ZRK36 TaxID=2866311 RepID=UPI001C73284B|nr:hypothetical protein [Ruficoccus sp. ZRK36]QYY36771.1 hypothetical protein K0V07_04665 [Ruficoccus sp. ZRK36]